MGHSTVHSIVHDVCKSIIKQLFAQCIPTPDKNQWEEIANRFSSLWNFPNCIGALDGKHVQITAPANSGSNYFNYKRTFSVVLLALVDADYRFIAVDIGSYGKNSDGGIFSNSKLGNALNNGTSDVPGSKQLPGSHISTPHVIIADSAFPLKTYMMRPYPQYRHDLTVERKIYNYRHCRGRRVVENGFGILAQRFRIYFRTITSKPGYIENIILVTCIFHNYLRNNRMSLIENNSHGELDQTTILNDLPSIGINAQTAAFNVREKFTNYFNSNEGSIPWQYECI